MRSGIVSPATFSSRLRLSARPLILLRSKDIPVPRDSSLRSKAIPVPRDSRPPPRPSSPGYGGSCPVMFVRSQCTRVTGRLCPYHPCYDVNVPSMSFYVHEWDIHVERVGANDASSR
jgi:hypothetical protein